MSCHAPLVPGPSCCYSGCSFRGRACKLDLWCLFSWRGRRPTEKCMCLLFVSKCVKQCFARRKLFGPSFWPRCRVCLRTPADCRRPVTFLPLNGMALWHRLCTKMPRTNALLLRLRRRTHWNSADRSAPTCISCGRHGRLVRNANLPLCTLLSKRPASLTIPGQP